METPQLSDISSFNPEDPQVRQIDLDSSSLSNDNSDVEEKKDAPLVENHNHMSHLKISSNESQNEKGDIAILASNYEKIQEKEKSNKESDEEDDSSEMSVAEEVDQRVVAEQNMSSFISRTNQQLTLESQKDSSSFWRLRAGSESLV